MVTIKDGCGCDPCDCDWKQKLKEAYARASVSVNKVGDFDGAIYYPDGSGFVKLPIPRLSEIQQISTNAQDIADLKVADIRLQANITAEENARIASITAEENARKAKDENLDGDIARIDSTDARQSELIRDNADRITSTYNDLVATEATVATHDSEIITLQANNQAITKSLVSDVIMTDGTTAGSVQVSIERADGALITSANYRWGRDIGIRLEAGTQAGYVKAVISLSDGTELVSNEYKIVEVLESDVYVTAITLVPDMTAGTIGGNISYSNGTTQTINAVNVPTAPGVTSAIEALQGRMSAVEQKNTQQDSSITALDSRVKAIEDTPGVGQFGAGKLGTIAGSTADGRVKAEDDGTGSVNGWSALKQRITTAEGQIVAAQNDISTLDGTVAQQTTDISGLMTDVTNIKTKNTQQDTAIAGKVAIDQGVANAGKALVVGEDGNIKTAPTSDFIIINMKNSSIDATFDYPGLSINTEILETGSNFVFYNSSSTKTITNFTSNGLIVSDSGITRTIPDYQESHTGTKKLRITITSEYNIYDYSKFISNFYSASKNCRFKVRTDFTVHSPRASRSFITSNNPQCYVEMQYLNGEFSLVSMHIGNVVTDTSIDISSFTNITDMKLCEVLEITPI